MRTFDGNASENADGVDDGHPTGTGSAAYRASPERVRGRVGRGGWKPSSLRIVHPAAAVGGSVPPSAEQMQVHDAGDAPGASEERQMQRAEKTGTKKKRGAAARVGVP